MTILLTLGVPSLTVTQQSSDDLQVPPLNRLAPIVEKTFSQGFGRDINPSYTNLRITLDVPSDAADSMVIDKVNVIGPIEELPEKQKEALEKQIGTALKWFTAKQRRANPVGMTVQTKEKGYRQSSRFTFNQQLLTQDPEPAARSLSSIKSPVELIGKKEEEVKSSSNEQESTDSSVAENRASCFTLWIRLIEECAAFFRLVSAAFISLLSGNHQS